MTLEKKYFSNRTHLKVMLYIAFVLFVPFVVDHPRKSASSPVSKKSPQGCPLASALTNLLTYYTDKGVWVRSKGMRR